MPVSGDLHGGTRHGCLPGEEGTPNCWSTEPPPANAVMDVVAP